MDSSNGFTTTIADRPTFGRVGELKNAFETTTTTNESTKDDLSKYRTSVSTGLTEQRRRMFEEQEFTSTNRRPVRKKKIVFDFKLIYSTCLGSIVAYPSCACVCFWVCLPLSFFLLY